MRRPRATDILAATSPRRRNFPRHVATAANVLAATSPLSQRPRIPPTHQATRQAYRRQPDTAQPARTTHLVYRKQITHHPKPRKSPTLGRTPTAGRRPPPLASSRPYSF